MGILDPIPVLNWRRRIRRFFRRFRWWIFFFLFLLVVAILSPFLKVVVELLRGGVAILKPLLDNPVGRVVLVSVLLVGIALIVWWRFAARIRKLIGADALHKFLVGMEHIVMRRWRDAIRAFEGVVKRSRFVDIEQAVPAYPDLVHAARIKLADCHRCLGELDIALRWIERVPVKSLPPDLGALAREVKARICDGNRGLLEETRRREVEQAVESDRENPRLLRLLRDRAEEAGRLGDAVRYQRQIAKATDAAGRAAERRALAVLLYRTGVEREEAGDLVEAEKAYRAAIKAKGFDLPWLRLGDLAWARGERRAAFEAWAQAPPYPALDRIAARLRRGELKGSTDLAEIVDRFPYAETLLVLARHFAEAGDAMRARNALTAIERLGLSGPAVDRLAAKLAKTAGDDEEAARRESRALRSFLSDGRL